LAPRWSKNFPDFVARLTDQLLIGPAAIISKEKVFLDQNYDFNLMPRFSFSS
jgi:hypothetical protein